ncbi:hypothetical protein K501DRAFT_332554 [Backusella circina FSU 941]|nr:hypothetical protein K501DRAFT_332554 [Backusella circina FSU 941]
MNTLPNELLVKIFHLIPDESKYQSSLVCRQWTVPGQTCLYYRVWINEKERFNKLLHTLKKNPLLRSLVIHFNLLSVSLSGSDKRYVCSMLPNLHTVRFQDPQNTTKPKNHNLLLQQDTQTLNPRLESLQEEGGDYELTRYLIHSDLCHQLEKLDINCFPRSKKTPNPMSLLTHMPVLTSLKLGLDGFSLTLDDIEHLHQRIPSITELSFSNAVLLPSKAVTPNTIIPNSIKSISWNFTHINNTLDCPEVFLQCFHYIQHKYPHLEKLCMLYNGYINFTIDEMRYIFEQGWLPILKSIGPQLKSLAHIDALPNMDLFKLLDEYHCNALESISAFSIYRILTLDEFTRSNQRHHVRELFLEGVFPMPRISLKDTKLEKLSLYYTGNEYETKVMFNDLLKQCPDSLENLVIMNAMLEHDEHDDFKSTITSLEVNMNGTGFIYGLFKENVHKFCPKLKHLSISDD